MIIAVMKLIYLYLFKFHQKLFDYLYKYMPCNLFEGRCLRHFILLTRFFCTVNLVVNYNETTSSRLVGCCGK